MSYTHIDVEFFKTFYDGNEGFKGKMISMFLEKAPGFMNEMEQYLEQEQWTDLAASAHKFKSCIDFVGAKGLREVANEIEKRAAESDVSVNTRLVASIQNICNDVVSELQTELSTVNIR